MLVLLRKWLCFFKDVLLKEMLVFLEEMLVLSKKTVVFLENTRVLPKEMIVFLKVFLWKKFVFLGRCYVFQRIDCVSRGDMRAS
jgi:hypothetical protein